MHLKQISIHHDRFPTRSAYPFNLPLLQKTHKLVFKHVTIFIGENGSGKSTLLKAICRRCGIHIWEGETRNRFEQNPYDEALHYALDAEWQHYKVPGSFFSPELFRNYTQLVDEWAISSPGILKHYGGDSLVTKSHGQSCMAYFRSIYQVKGLYFLDEPEAALSPKTQLELLSLLEEISDRGHAQFIISTHSPLLMSLKHAELLNFDAPGIEPVAFKDTQHFKVYKSFFDAFE